MPDAKQNIFKKSAIDEGTKHFIKRIEYETSFYVDHFDFGGYLLAKVDFLWGNIQRNVVNAFADKNHYR